MSTALACYLLVSIFAAFTCLWSAVTAAACGDAHRRSAHRAVAILAGVALPVATGLAAFGPALGHPEAGLLLVLLAPLTLLAAWSNLATLHRAGWAWHLLHLPIAGWNVTLLGLHALRALAETTGYGGGAPGAALTSGYAVLQTLVGQTDAGVQPIWLGIPLMLPLSNTPRRWPHGTVVAAAAGCATALLAALAGAMPLAWRQTTDLSSPRAVVTETGDATPTRLGVHVAWGDRLWPDSTRAIWRARLVELGASRVVVRVDAETFDDAALVAQLRDELDHARSTGFETVVECHAPRRLEHGAAATFAEQHEPLAAAHWHAAEALAPDVVVVFVGPYGTLQAPGARADTVEAWRDRITRAADDVHRANEEIRIGVALESRGPHAHELFASLRGLGSPVDEITLTFLPSTPFSLATVDRELHVARRWCSAPGAGGDVWLAAGVAPHGIGGGEDGQAALLGSLADAAAEPGDAIVGLCALSLTDTSDGHRGLLRVTGAPRRAFTTLRSKSRPDRPAATPGTPAGR